VYPTDLDHRHYVTCHTCEVLDFQSRIMGLTPDQVAIKCSLLGCMTAECW